MTEPNHSRTPRIPSLDGLRGLCISAVLFDHLAGTGGFPVSAHAAERFSLGMLAVMAFLVISGFLITKMLLDELARSGRIQLGRFFVRRTLRIFPPYFVLIGGIVAADALGWISLRPNDVIHAVTYTSNYHLERSWYLGHTWSLSVQEQFYLLWPVVIVLAGTRRAVLFAAFFILLAPFIRVGEWELIRWAGQGIGHRFETIADAIAAGCVLACVRPRLHAIPLYRKLLESPFFFLVPALAVVANMMHDHPLIAFGVSITVINICIMLCFDWYITFPKGRVARVLNTAPLTSIGLISYSLYLWQQLFLVRESAAWTAQFPANLLLALLAGVVSFYAVERPAIEFRKRLDERQRRPASTPPVATDQRTDVATPLAIAD